MKHIRLDSLSFLGFLAVCLFSAADFKWDTLPIGGVGLASGKKP